MAVVHVQVALPPLVAPVLLLGAVAVCVAVVAVECAAEVEAAVAEVAAADNRSTIILQ